jgi:hypothetical protein
MRGATMASYTIFDSVANLVDSFDDRQEAHAALSRIVEREPDAADEYALIECDDSGHPVGQALTGSAIAAHA